jgi:hypothetical protein
MRGISAIMKCMTRESVQETDTNVANKSEHVKIQYQACIIDHRFSFMGPRFQIISDVRSVRRNYVREVEPRLKTDSGSAGQEIVHLSWILIFNNCVHKTSGSNFILSQPNPVHNFKYRLSSK